MPRSIQIRTTRTLAAPAERVYDILADYKVGHPSILPARAFTGLKVERGGRGDGTVIQVGMKAFGKRTSFRATISEPEPGRVLVEREIEGNGVVTTFTVHPEHDGRSAAVTIETSWTPRGPGAFVERWLAPPYLRGVYKEELQNLEKVATGAL